MSVNSSGPADEHAANVLLKELDRNQSYRQETVVASLVQIGYPAVAGLIKRLGPSTDLDVRQRAALILGRIGPDARDAMAALIESVVDRDRDMRNEAIRALKQIDPNWLTSEVTQQAIPMLIEKLGSRSDGVHNTAKLVLSTIGTPAVPDLIRTLSNAEDDQHQGLAAETLGRIGVDAASAVSPLNQALNSDHLHVRRLAAEALGRIGPAAEPAVPNLLQKLADESLAVRGVAAKALAQLESAFEVAAPAVLQLLVHKSAAVRQDAVDALATMGLCTIPLIVDLLEAPDIHHLLQGRLQQLEENVRTYQRWLERQYENQDQLLSRHEASNIDWYRHELAAELTPEFDATVRLAALQVLSEIGPPTQSAEPTLLSMLRHERPDMREAAAKALAVIRPETSATVNALMHVLLDRYEPVCMAAELALDVIEPEWRVTPMADPVMQSLIVEMKQGHSAAGIALLRFGRAAVPKLMGLLGDESRTVRQSAIDLLGTIGPDAESAIAALADVADNDANGLVRRAAERALMQIRQ
ncbi:HEAT repeat domain-containing protein [Candidatus Entotheonella palauensis]|uniref:HEAT repeat domain-containing protein n=1 Tax=Candidatus Entotheonella palauensis TaxID=93172 RepID=UPI000B7FEEBA|nr:HEAT repeat domain-containing protein [Candidatus Entotheonella palauensis]